MQILSLTFLDQIVVWNEGLFRKKMIDFSDSFKSKLEKYDFDMVVSRTYIKSQDIGQYIRDLGKDYLRALKDGVSKYFFFPYLVSALASHKLYSSNMFIMKKELYDDYCRLVFGILELQMKRIVSNSWCLDPIKEGCYSILSGYLAEILTSAYVMKKVTEGGNILYVNSVFLAK